MTVVSAVGVFQHDLGAQRTHHMHSQRPVPNSTNSNKLRNQNVLITYSLSFWCCFLPISIDTYMQKHKNQLKEKNKQHIGNRKWK